MEIIGTPVGANFEVTMDKNFQKDEWEIRMKNAVHNINFLVAFEELMRIGFEVEVVKDVANNDFQKRDKALRECCEKIDNPFIEAMHTYITVYMA